MTYKSDDMSEESQLPYIPKLISTQNVDNNNIV